MYFSPMALAAIGVEKLNSGWASCRVIDSAMSTNFLYVKFNGARASNNLSPLQLAVSLLRNPPGAGVHGWQPAEVTFSRSILGNEVEQRMPELEPI
jgi:hypothetical protein